MLYKLVRWISFACCAFVLVSFGMFANDQLSKASDNQQRTLAAQVGQKGPKAPSHTRHGQPRRFIDDVAAKLTSPFHSILQTHSKWGQELFTSLLALLVYGLGLGFIARFASGSRHGLLLKPV